MLDTEGQTGLTLSIFYARIVRVRTLREHRLWEIVRLLFIDLPCARAGTRKRLESLVLSNAMLDAVVLLTALSAPRRFVGRIDNEYGNWSCAVRVDGLLERISQSTHQDLAAAILGSLILSYLQMPTDPWGSRTTSPRLALRCNPDET